MRGLGEVRTPSTLESALSSWPYRVFALVGTALGAYHGYKRNASIGWAIGWAILGGAFPFITIPVSLAQGYGKARKANRRRRNVKLRPGQKWQRSSGEAWKACSSCTAPIGPFDSIAQAEAHDSQCWRCSSLETATTGTFKAVKRRNRRRPRVMNRRVRGPYFYYARGFTLGRQGAPLAGLESMTGVERRAAQDGYVAGEMAMTAQVVTEAAGRRIRNRGRGRVPNGGSRRRNGPSKARVIAAVNEAGRLSRRGGAPMLSTGSSREVILRWLQWNDPNGVYVDSCAEFRNGDMDLIDEDLAWELLTQAVEEDL